MFPKPRRVKDENLLAEVRKYPCTFCGRSDGIDAAHIKTTGSGGDDVWSNLLPLCRLHHRVQHDKGWKWMCEVSYSVEQALKERGWKLSKVGKLYNN